jgi:hypothetical protein
MLIFLIPLKQQSIAFRRQVIEQVGVLFQIYFQKQIYPLIVEIKVRRMVSRKRSTARRCWKVALLCKIVPHLIEFLVTVDWREVK